jgi:hypothetical protein
VHGITSITGAELLFVFKACPVFITGAPQQAHSVLCNCCGNAEDGQQDKSVAEVILCTFLNQQVDNPVIKSSLLSHKPQATSI